MGHGTPIHVAAANAGEAAGPYMLDVGLSSTRRILRFWKLDRHYKSSQPEAPQAQRHAVKASVRPRFERITPPQASPVRLPIKMQEVIEKALKGAGLMK
jgi:hypothetical protein